MEITTVLLDGNVYNRLEADGNAWDDTSSIAHGDKGSSTDFAKPAMRRVPERASALTAALRALTHPSARRYHSSSLLCCRNGNAPASPDARSRTSPPQGTIAGLNQP